MVTLHTIGHSNRDIETLLGLLAAHHVETLVDIRAFPRSRRYPQYDRATLASHLARADVRYEWAGDAFGGFRKPRRDSRHTALTDAAFRGFADYMESARFAAAIDALVARAACKRTAIMCAEAEHRTAIASSLPTTSRSAGTPSCTSRTLAQRGRIASPTVSTAPARHRFTIGTSSVTCSRPRTSQPAECAAHRLHRHQESCMTQRAVVRMSPDLEPCCPRRACRGYTRRATGSSLDAVGLPVPGVQR
ncbi:MAG: DUF488 domain-containing protein [Gammaproteobacteria bacterium]